MELTEGILAEWRQEAEQHPSGQPCNGIHDATSDRRVVVLVDALTARSADMEARIRALADEVRTWPRYGPCGFLDEIPARSVEAFILALLDAAPAGGAETTPGIREFWSETACHADRDGECHWEGCPQLCDGEPKATGRHCPLDAPSEVPHD